ACCIGVVAWVTYYSVRAEIRLVFNNELQQVAQAVQLREDWTGSGRMRIARPGFSLAVRAYDKTGRVHFQTALPALPPDSLQTFEQGYSYMDTDEGRWRVYTHVTPEGIVQVGQPLATRDALARSLAFRSLVPLALLVPVLTLVVMWALGR